MRRGGGGSITLEPTPSSCDFWRRRGFGPSGKLLAKKLRLSEDEPRERLCVCLTRFAPEEFYTRALFTVHHKPFTPEGFLDHAPLIFYTRGILYQKPFTPEAFHTTMALHHNPFTAENFYTTSLLCQSPLRQKSFLLSYATLSYLALRCSAPSYALSHSTLSYSARRYS